MHTVISGSRKVGLYTETGILVKRWIMNKDVIGAYVSGDTVTINCVGGCTYIYRHNGVLVRILHHR